MNFKKGGKSTATKLIIHLTDKEQQLMAFDGADKKGVTVPSAESIGSEMSMTGIVDLFIGINPAILNQYTDEELGQQFSYYSLFGLYFLMNPPQLDEKVNAQIAKDQNAFANTVFKLPTRSFITIVKK
jgi:hypothetical protein